jgi:hypothetical protein
MLALGGDARPREVDLDGQIRTDAPDRERVAEA